MKKRILAILGLIAYILFIVWFTLKGIPTKEEMDEMIAEKNSVETTENVELEEKQQ